VLHDTESASALGTARYFTQPNSGGSAHYVIDTRDIFQCLADNEVPWGARSASQISANTRGMHIEQVGFARWNKEQWYDNIEMLLRTAWITARIAKKYKIPAVFVTSFNLINSPKLKGITTHNEISLASKKLDPSNASRYDHTDPGPNWPRALFMTMVKDLLSTV
jgi:N-acetyl-anhydromuramyl-L-alanine amidase AmpD